MLKLLTVTGLIATSLMSFTAAVTSEKYTAVKEKTKIQWTGKKVGGEHEGIVKLKSGELTMEGDIITAGTLIMDMTTIRPTDTESKKLSNHIRGEDFFNVKAYPESKLVITSSKALEGDKLEITGKMTILDKTQDITFIAVNTAKTENYRFYSSNISIDRTKYGITYKSSLLGDATIRDNFDIKVKLVVKKS
jgi:polyisoprenoid-binding protein YceI